MNVRFLPISTDRKKSENNRKSLKNLKNLGKRKRSRSDAYERSVKQKKRNKQWRWKGYRRRMILLIVYNNVLKQLWTPEELSDQVVQANNKYLHLLE